MSDSHSEKPRKSVGFAAETEIVEPEPYKPDPSTLEASPFFKIPPELAYLKDKNRAPNPAPILLENLPRPSRSSIAMEDLGDLRILTIKDFSVQNRGTLMNFHYPTINRPIGLNRVLVDVKYASLGQYDLHKIAKYPLNLSSQRIGLGYDFSGVVSSVGPNVKDFKANDMVFGMLDTNSRKGALATSINVRLGRDVLIKVSDIEAWDNVNVALSGDKKDNVFVLNDDDETLVLAKTGLRESGDRDTANGATDKLATDDTVNSVNTEPKKADVKKDTQEANADINRDVQQSHVGSEHVNHKQDESDSVDSGDSESKPKLDIEPEPETANPPQKQINADATDDLVADHKDVPNESNKPKSMVTAVLTAPPVKRVPKAKLNFSFTEIPPLAKLSLFGSAYCRAKQTLQHLKPKERSNVLINGGDTELGLTILQVLASSLYSHIKVNVVLVVRDRLLLKMTELVDVIIAHCSHIQVKLVTYDSPVKDLILPGEKVPINYKARMVFSKQVVEAMLDCNESLDPKLCKLDLMVDVVGCMQYFYYEVKLDLHNEKLDSVFRCKNLELLLVKILKPKLSGSCLVSCCPFDTPDPTYEVEFLNKKPEDIEDAVPWSGSWWSNPVVNGLFGVALPYHYVEEIELKFRKDWIQEGLDLARKGELKSWLVRFCDWREGLRQQVNALRKQDGRILLKIEDF